MTCSAFCVAIVDDEESVRKGLSRLFRSTGIKVECFGSGQDFLDSLLIKEPDCLVLDLHMPALTGLEVLNRMSERGVTIRTVVITGHDTPGMRERMLATGVAAYLLKPLDCEILLGAVGYSEEP